MIQKKLLAGFLVGILISSMLTGAALTFSNRYPISGAPPYSASDSGPTIKVGVDTDVASGNPFPDGNTFELQSTAGNATFSSSVKTSARVDQITGTETKLSNMDVTNGTLTIDPEDKQAVRVEGDTDHLNFRSMEVDDGSSDFSYGGPDGGTTTLTITDLPASSTIVAVGSDGTELDTAVSSSGGEATFQLPQSDHTVLLQSGETAAPEFSNPDPTGPQSTTPTDLEVNVSDEDFDSDTDEEVQVNISLDGTKIHSETITNETRVTASVGSLSPGDHTWTVEAVDQYGNERTSTYTFGLPDNLSFYNESAPDSLINDREITTTVYSDGEEVFTRNTTDGNISLEGLPAMSDIVIVAEANGYITRSVIIEDITKQQRMYLLNDSASTVEVRFEIDDVTGQYSAEETQLFVKRPLEVNGSTTYQTVVASDFGAAAEVTTDLEQDVRYRLVVKNDDGDRQVLGTYTATVSETVTLRPSSLELNYTDGEPYSWDAGFINDTAGPRLTFEFSDPARETTNLRITIYEKGNESNTLGGYPVTYSGPLGNVSISEPLTSEQADKEWVIRWEADRNGNTISAQQGASDITVQLAELDPWWQQAFGFAVLLITGGVFSRANVGVGAMTVALIGGVFYWIGWFSGVTSGAAVAMGLGVAVLVWSTQRGGI